MLAGRDREDEVRPVTALFADIVGSTGLGELLRTEELKVLIGECVSRMTEVVEQYEGTVGSYMGDGIAAFFGVKRAREDDHIRAALAALELQHVIVGFSQEVELAWGVRDLSVRIGINAGRVATGPVGGKEPQVVALGDAVNVAARLQGLAAPGSILVGESVARRLAGRFLMRPLGPVQIRGRTKTVQTYELLGENRSGERPATSVVGRQHELAQLTTLLSDLSAGRGQVAVIVGEAGIGKTKLLAEIRARAGSAITWIATKCELYEGCVPYGPFADAMRLWLGLEPGYQDVVARVRLRAALHELGDGSDELLPHLARLLGVRLHGKLESRFEGLPLDVLTRKLHDSYCAWLLQLAKKTPIVLAIDNFGRVDAATQQLAEQVLTLTDKAPMFLIITMRPEYETAGWRLRVRALADYAHRTTEIHPGPLDRDEAALLISQMDPDATLTPDVRATVISRAEGNPLYLEELCNAVRGRGVATPLSGDERPLLPPALDTLLFCRIDWLPDDAKRVLQGAAVVGREFSKPVIAEMALVDDLDGALAVLLRTDLIRERQREPMWFAFKHGLLREAALATLTENVRRELHAQAAQSIEAVFGRASREHVEDLMRHNLASGDTAAAAEFLEELGERLASLYRLQEAIESFERCRSELCSRDDTVSYRRVTKRLAELCAEVGQHERAVELLSELERDDRESAQTSEITVAKANVLFEGGDIVQARKVIEEFLNDFGGSEYEKEALVLRAQMALRQQDFIEVRKVLERLGDLSNLDLDLAFESASLWTGYLAGEGDFSAARIWVGKALDYARRISRTSVELRAERYVGVVCLLNGSIQEAHRRLRSAYEKSSELGHVAGCLESGINLLHTAHLLGLLEEGVSLGAELRTLSESPFWNGLVLSNLASLKCELGFLGEAESLAREVLISSRGTVPSPARLSAWMVLAQVSSSKEDWSAAYARLHSAEKEAEQYEGRRGQLVMLQTVLAEVALSEGDYETAVKAAKSGLEETGFAERPIQVPVLRLMGSAVSYSEPQQGERLLREALGLARSMEMRLEEARCLVALGIHSVEERGCMLAEARDLFASCGCERGLRELSRAEEQFARA